MNASDILEHLAASMSLTETFTPPTLGVQGNFAFADARLSVFRSTEHWVTVFELVQHYDLYFETCLYLFGNCLQSEGFQSQYGPPCVTVSGTSAVTSREDILWNIGRKGFSLSFKGQVLHFSPTAEEYVAAGIVLDESLIGTVPGSLVPIQLLRFLCHSLNHPFFLSDDYFRFVIDALRLDRTQYLSPQMSVLLQTTRWQHPDIINDEDAAYLPYFQALSRAIATGDTTELDQVDPSLFNTGWKDWPT